eukprot:SAG31_NODE_2187_length_6236_cov_2.337135_4_plen_211_part_00
MLSDGSARADGSIIPETVPQSQRGLCTAINAWISQVFLIAGAGCGILVGEGHISDELVWDLAILCAYMQVPLATWAFSGKACAPWKAVLYPFLWSNDAKERMPSKRQLAEKAAQTKRELKGFALTKGCDVFAREVREFFSPFKTPAYRYLWIQSFVGTIGGIIQGAFSFYWCGKQKLFHRCSGLLNALSQNFGAREGSRTVLRTGTTSSG